MALPAPDEVDDLDLIAIVDDGRGVRVPPDDHHVVLDGHTTRIDVERGQQCADGDRPGKLLRLAVESYRQILLQCTPPVRSSDTSGLYP